jgi:hypothetical protein
MGLRKEILAVITASEEPMTIEQINAAVRANIPPDELRWKDNSIRTFVYRMSTTGPLCNLNRDPAYKDRTARLGLYDLLERHPEHQKYRHTDDGGEREGVVRTLASYSSRPQT